MHVYSKRTTDHEKPVEWWVRYIPYEEACVAEMTLEQ